MGVLPGRNRGRVRRGVAVLAALVLSWPAAVISPAAFGAAGADRASAAFAHALTIAPDGAVPHSAHRPATSDEHASATDLSGAPRERAGAPSAGELSMQDAAVRTAPVGSFGARAPPIEHAAG